jgi:hypothetical protein
MCGHSAWLDALGTSLRRSVDDAPCRVIRFDMSELAALWGCPSDEAERILCEAALRAGLAVGVVDRSFCDVMTIEEAQAALEEICSSPTQRDTCM